MTVPKLYQWLLSEPGPKMLVEGLKLYGTRELSGKQHNPVILDWAKEVGLQNVYVADEIPWCGLVQAVIAKRAGYEIVKDPLWALNWAKFGNPVETPMLGDTCSFKRPGGGHVGLYVGEDKTAYHILGGNQANAYNITRVEKVRLYRACRPEWKIGQPENVRRVFLSSTGLLSKNEA